MDSPTSKQYHLHLQMTHQDVKFFIFRFKLESIFSQRHGWYIASRGILYSNALANGFANIQTVPFTFTDDTSNVTLNFLSSDSNLKVFLARDMLEVVCVAVKTKLRKIKKHTPFYIDFN
jgi:hypothetical protein